MLKKQDSFDVKICFVSLSSYPLLVNKNLNYVGGAEVQQVELAKELKKRGYNISFITYGEKYSDVKGIDGIEIVPTYDRVEKNDINFLKKALCLWRKMREVDADIYIYHSGSAGITSIFAKIHKKKILNLLASDYQVTGKAIIKISTTVTFLEKIGNWLDLKLSDVVISQNNFQKAKLKSKFNVESIVVRNAFDIPSQSGRHCSGDYILWIGTVRSVKNPDLFLETAKHFPEYKFLMIGGEGENTELFRKIKNAANGIINLKFAGFVERNKIFDYYKKAILLVSTSKTEGFPNVFLEAWMHSIPVISLNVDPDGIISKYGMGRHSKTFEQMLDDIKTVLENKKLLQTMGENGRKYVEINHDIKTVADQYENLIRNLLINKFGNKRKIEILEKEL